MNIYHRLAHAFKLNYTCRDLCQEPDGRFWIKEYCEGCGDELNRSELKSGVYTFWGNDIFVSKVFTSNIKNN